MLLILTYFVNQKMRVKLGVLPIFVLLQPSYRVSFIVPLLSMSSTLHFFLSLPPFLKLPPFPLTFALVEPEA